MHGQGGVSFYERNWEEILLQMGFATFLVDSKSNRGCHQVFGGCAAQHHGMAHMVDAFQALKILSSHPKIDSKRIALFGISIGGKATLYAGVKRFKKLWSHAGQNFAAYVPLYPPCNTTFLQDEFADGNPVRIHIGEKDEWASATACKDYVKRLQNKGKDISVVVYPGAHHGFDTEDHRVSGGIDIPGWQNVNCRFRESLELGDVPQQVVQIKSENGSKKPSLSRIAYLMYDDSCATGSARLEYDSGAASRARQSIEKFLVSVLKNP